MTHLYDQIARNRRLTFVLIVGVTALLIVTGYFLGAALGNRFAGMAIAFLVSVILSLVSYFTGDQIVLSTMGAKEADRTEHKALYNIVEEMCIAGGMPLPKVYVIESPASNAFATGRNPRCASIAVTTGIMEILNREELQAVIGHEMSHVRNRDTLYAVMMGIMVGAIAIMCDAYWRMLRYSRYAGRGKKAAQAQAVVYLIAMILAILAPICAQIIQFAMSRRREYLADEGSVELTRNPEALASALEKISGDPDPLDVANRGTQHLFIINPLTPASHAVSGLSGLFSTHPPIRERIRILRQMAHAMPKSAEHIK